MMRYCFVVLFFFFSGCSVGHQDWIKYRNEMIGEEIKVPDSFEFENAGKLQRANFLIQGKGLTHITKNEDGDLVLHWDISEVLPVFRGNKEWIGKCLTYMVVDSNTHILKSWGFNKGGNPLSCRTWP